MVKEALIPRGHPRAEMLRINLLEKEPLDKNYIWVYARFNFLV